MSKVIMCAILACMLSACAGTKPPAPQDSVTKWENRKFALIYKEF